MASTPPDGSRRRPSRELAPPPAKPPPGLAEVPGDQQATVTIDPDARRPAIAPARRKRADPAETPTPPSAGHATGARRTKRSPGDRGDAPTPGPDRATVVTVADPSQRPAPAKPAAGPHPDRYEPLRLLGSGGFGEVRLVRDRVLGRDVAMKILRPDLDVSPEMRARFLAEIQLTAGLTHPGIVAVHEAGELPDGQLWYTMPVVRGRTFRAVIDAAFMGDPRASRRRLLDLFGRACDAVAYAHGKGVIHRDIKPENIMIGEHGEVLVMDWGIARRADAPESAPGRKLAPAQDESPEARVARALSFSPLRTRPGAILGTPAYMAPEQARGEVHRHGPATDVYALGALLLQVLTGRPPDVGPRFWEPSESVRDQIARLDEDPDLPADLAEICRRAMDQDPARRYPDAGALAAELRAFLEGAQRREQALADLAEAEGRAGTLASLREQAALARAELRRALAAVRPSDPVERKVRGWDLEDEAERLERELALEEAHWIQIVHSALAKDPALPEAHAALADHYRGKLAEAELAGRAADAVRLEVLLRAHDRGQHAAFLRGDGALTLVTDPPGAEVLIQKYALRQRRLVAEPARLLGRTPIHEMALPFGSYLLTLRAPGRIEVRYPVAIERGGAWDGRRPGEKEPFPILLPRVEDQDDGEVYVPAGWAWIGGDPEAADSLPRRRVWVDAFAMGRFPVTSEGLVGLLNTMASAGISDADLGFPSGRPGLVETASALPAVTRGPDGRFVLRPAALRKDGPEAPPDPAWPATLDWHLAVACARFLSLREKRPFRLPNELEREKAARGADGRFFVWGNHAEPGFACTLESHRAEPLPEQVTGHPGDESPYGVRGLSGNVRDWCANVWRHDGPAMEGDRLRLSEALPDDDDFRVIKGGAWGSSVVHSRAAARFGSRPGLVKSYTGFRLVRSIPG